ncbi:MAG TPA: hypothetical protein VK666_20025 [Chryseolinea sp.]|nr:hypothetical protein [Chryseolinea sp.]
MRNSLPGVLFLVTFNVISAFAQVGLEQYGYVNKEGITPVSIFNYQAKDNAYVEARYNYEALNSFSIYLGRTFAGTRGPTYSVTPILGCVFGAFKGVSAGANVAIEYKKLFFSTQSQYTRAFYESNADFLFAWSDVGYQLREWLYIGLSTQQTYQPQGWSSQIEPGIALGVTLGKWTFPLYCFSPGDNLRYFVVGINYGVAASKRTK